MPHGNSRTQAFFPIVGSALLSLAIAFCVSMSGCDNGLDVRQNTETQCRIVSAAIKDYHVDVGALPNKLEDLVEDPGLPGWQGSYLNSDTLPYDAWGNVLLYDQSRGPYFVFSAGPDGRPYTRDDITRE